MCETDADCPRPDLGQVCTKIYWDATIDGSQFANGEACYNYEEPVCPGKPFASVNYNYDNSLWSYYVQYECTSESIASSLIVTSAFAYFALSAF